MEWVSGLEVLVAIHLLVFLVPIPIKYRIRYLKTRRKKNINVLLKLDIEKYVMLVELSSIYNKLGPRTGVEP